MGKSKMDRIRKKYKPGRAMFFPKNAEAAVTELVIDIVALLDYIKALERVTEPIQNMIAVVEDLDKELGHKSCMIILERRRMIPIQDALKRLE